jgi:tetratricopeptide (TPR) repeat protein
LTYLAHALLELGYPAQSLLRIQEALENARAMDHGPTLAFTLFNVCFFRQRYGGLEAQRVLVDELIAVCAAHGLSAFGSIGVACRGHLSMLSEPSETALAEIEAGMNTWRGSSAQIITPWFLTLLAQAYGALDRPERGLACLDDALGIVKLTNERLYLPGVLQTKAELLLAGPTPDPSRAEASFEEAIRISREMDAHLPELRAATRLARLWRQQDRSKESLQLVVDCLDWFSEGFDAPDLQVAQALVDELKPPADADVG